MRDHFTDFVQLCKLHVSSSVLTRVSSTRDLRYYCSSGVERKNTPVSLHEGDRCLGSRVLVSG